MKSFFTIVLVLLLFSSAGLSQETGFDKKIISNTDPLLYNGKYYLYFYPPRTKGNQYFENGDYLPGSITLRGVVYNNLNINYDVFHEQLLLKFVENSGAVNQIIISDAWLESFSFMGLNFEVITEDGSAKEIFQVLGKHPIKVLYKWRKELKLDASYGSTNYVFSNLKKEMFLIKDGKKMKYWNKKSFLSHFDPEIKDNLEDYIKNHRINFRKGDNKIEDLINFSNSIIQK